MKSTFARIALYIGLALLVPAVSIAATTISTNIQTGGTLSVTGQSILTGNVGIATSTPGSVLSVGGVGNFTSATSTFYSTGGINLAGGCFSVNGTCVGSSGGGSGTVNSGTAGYLPYYATNGTTLSPTSYLQLITGTNNNTFSIGGPGNQASIANDPPHLFDIENDNTTEQMFRMAAYGTGGALFQNNMHFYRMGGTAASPSATQSGMFLLSMGFRGYDGATTTQSAAAYQVLTPSTWTTSNHEAMFQWQVTPNGSVTRNQAMQLNGNGSLYLTNESSWTPFRSDGILHIDDSASGYNKQHTIIVQGNPANGAQMLIGEDTTNETFIGRNGTTAGFNLAGTSVSGNGLAQFQNGNSGEIGVYVKGTPIYNLVGGTGSNAGTRLDATGLRITTLSDLTSSASARLDVEGNGYFSGKVAIGTSTAATQLQVSSGASATTTVTVGELGLTSSKACVNMNRSDGGPGSFYINAAGAGVFEANYCR